MGRDAWAAISLSALMLVTGCTAQATPEESTGQSWQPGDKEYGIAANNDVVVPMSDGIELHVSVSYPTELGTDTPAKGPFPVLLTQNPYVGGGPSVEDQEFFVSRGYIYATAEVRGTQQSGGEFDMWSDREIQDASSSPTGRLTPHRALPGRWG